MTKGDLHASGTICKAEYNCPLEAAGEPHFKTNSERESWMEQEYGSLKSLSKKREKVININDYRELSHGEKLDFLENAENIDNDIIEHVGDGDWTCDTDKDLAEALSKNQNLSDVAVFKKLLSKPRYSLYIVDNLMKNKSVSNADAADLLKYAGDRGYVGKDDYAKYLNSFLDRKNVNADQLEAVSFEHSEEYGIVRNKPYFNLDDGDGMLSDVGRRVINHPAADSEFISALSYNVTNPQIREEMLEAEISAENARNGYF